MKIKNIVFTSVILCFIVLSCIILPKQIMPLDLASDKLCDNYTNQDKTDLRINSDGVKQVKINTNWYNLDEVENSCISK